MDVCIPHIAYRRLCQADKNRPVTSGCREYRDIDTCPNEDLSPPRLHSVFLLSNIGNIRFWSINRWNTLYITRVHSYVMRSALIVNFCDVCYKMVRAAVDTIVGMEGGCRLRQTRVPNPINMQSETIRLSFNTQKKNCTQMLQLWNMIIFRFL